MKSVEGFDKARPLLYRQSVPVSGDDSEREQALRQIIDDVRRRGDAALFEYTQKLDGVKLAALEVERKQVNQAYRETDKELISAMKLAVERISSYHLEQKRLLLKANNTSHT